jgi:undecaprenyl-diphosphatase
MVRVTALAGTLVAARREGPTALDRRVAVLVSGGDRASTDRAIGVWTDLGSVYGLTGVVAALLLRRRPALAADVAVAGGTAWVVAQAAKRTVDRRRPYQVGLSPRLVAEPAGSSWPSGHTAVAAAIATALAPALGPVGSAAAPLVVASVAASRLWVGVHWCSDVVAGAAVGRACADVAAVALRRVRG